MVVLVGLFVIVIGLVVHPPEKIAHESEKARKAHERRFRQYESASQVWRQLSRDDRRYVLERAEYADLAAADDDTLSSIKATGAQRDRIINAIRFAPRDSRFSARYKAAQGTRPRDVRVRPHEKRLREKGLRRPTAIRAREGAVVSTTT